MINASPLEKPPNPDNKSRFSEEDRDILRILADPTKLEFSDLGKLCEIAGSVGIKIPLKFDIYSIAKAPDDEKTRENQKEIRDYIRKKAVRILTEK